MRFHTYTCANYNTWYKLNEKDGVFRDAPLNFAIFDVEFETVFVTPVRNSVLPGFYMFSFSHEFQSRFFFFWLLFRSYQVPPVILENRTNIKSSATRVSVGA